MQNQLNKKKAKISEIIFFEQKIYFIMKKNT